MPSITVLARARAKKGSEADVEKTVRAAMAPTHAEEGCLKYAFHQGLEDPAVFVMIEKWASKESLDRHLASPHIRTLFTDLPKFLETSMEIQVLKNIPDGQPQKGTL